MKLFNVNQLSNAYFSGNKMGEKLRKNLKNNTVKRSQEEYDKIMLNFLSKTNLDNVNKVIKEIIFIEMNVKIPLQDKKELEKSAKFVVEYRFDEIINKKNPVKILNKILIDSIIPNLKTNILQKIKYLKDIDYSNRKINNLPQSSRSNNHLPSMSDKLSFEQFKFNY